jgi:hypothetical protein
MTKQAAIGFIERPAYERGTFVEGGDRFARAPPTLVANMYGRRRANVPDSGWRDRPRHGIALCLPRIRVSWGFADVDYHKYTY